MSTKQIKTRIRSMEATRQITKAMEMVASSKLRKAQAQALAAKPYFETLYAVLQQIASANRETLSPYLKASEGTKPLYVVIAGDRGLAGGYHHNLFKLVLSQIHGGNAWVLPIGRKTSEYFKHIPIPPVSVAETGRVTVDDCFALARQLCKLYREGACDRLYIAYTDFESVLSQKPDILQVLPLPATKRRKRTKQVTWYEPDADEVFDAIIPEYVGGILYGGLCKSRAAEHAARRNAMDAATKNADEMIEKLRAQYNRVRQAAITQEITEIVAGVKRS